MLRLALPSDGELYEPSLAFLKACGLPLERASARRYTGVLGGLRGATVLLQRMADITHKVQEGSAELGIVGLDRFLEYRREESPVALVMEDLGFGSCELVVAVPDTWLDISSMDDLADLSLELRQQGKQLRVATKYPRLVERYFLSRGINYFTLVPASGALEAAPAAGYADMIADISSTGTTLRENRLKTLEDGTILSSQACLIGNLKLLAERPEALRLARAVLERMEAYLMAGNYYRITSNIRGRSPEEVASHILSRPELSGLQGPTVAPVFGADSEGWYEVSLIVPREQLLEAVDHLRHAGATDIASVQVNYLFRERCHAYEHLLQLLGREG